MTALAFGHHEDRTPTHGYAESRDAAMAAFAISWRRERDIRLLVAQKVAESLFAKDIRTALAIFCKFDDSFR
jgi:hypothetical protein